MLRKRPYLRSRYPKLFAAAVFACWAIEALACCATAEASASSHTNGTLRLGDIAPKFTLQGIKGGTIELDEGRGDQPMLLVFWSYFCFPCQKEIPGLQAVYEELGPQQLAVIGINLDGPSYAQKLRPFLAENSITFPTAYDNLTDEFFEVAERYGVVGTPTSFLLDSSGRVRFMQLGRVDRETLKGLLRSVSEQSYCSEIIKPE